MRVVPGVVAVMAVVGCARSAGEVEAGERGQMSSDLAASMEVEVSGGVVGFTLHVTNRSSSPVVFTFPSSQRYDFVVETPAGETVWRWSEGMAFLQAITRAELQAGETWDFEAEWAPEGRSGRLEAVGRVTARDHELEQRTTFDLP